MKRYLMETAGNDTLGFPLHYLASELVPRMPAIIYLHGFTGCRDSHLDVRMGLADLGFLVVSFDASRHGERGALPDLWNSCRKAFLPTFVRVLAETSDDAVRVFRALQGDPRFDGERIGIVGGSMGGMACLMTVPRCAGLKVAVSMAGTVDLLRWIDETSGRSLYDFRTGRIDGELQTLLREYDAIHHLDGFAPVPLLLVNGGKDDIVPPRGQRDLAEKLAPYYAGQPSRLRFSLYPDLAHETSPALLEEVHRWLRQFL
jgi:dienelactone hydrolase